MCDSKITSNCREEEKRYLLDDGRKVCSSCLPFTNGHDKNNVIDLSTGNTLYTPLSVPHDSSSVRNFTNEPGHGFPGGVK
jgi:hypothetical protein